MMEDVKKVSIEEWKRRIAKEPPLNIGIFVTGGEADQKVAVPGEEAAV